jgi:hypothetical protein
VKPFWPLGRNKLFVEFHAVNGHSVATGVDDTNATVFTAVMLTEQEAAFLAAIRIGTAGIPLPASNDNQPPGSANTVVVSDPGPGDKGPKLWAVPLMLTAGLVPMTARSMGA